VHIPQQPGRQSFYQNRTSADKKQSVKIEMTSTKGSRVANPERSVDFYIQIDRNEAA